MDVPRYEYNAIDDYGKKVRGTLLAPDENSIRETLASMGLPPLPAGAGPAGGGPLRILRPPPRSVSGKLREHRPGGGDDGEPRGGPGRPGPVPHVAGGGGGDDPPGHLLPVDRRVGGHGADLHPVYLRISAVHQDLPGGRGGAPSPHAHRDLHQHILPGLRSFPARVPRPVLRRSPTLPAGGGRPGGGALRAAREKAGESPPMVVRMLSAGESTGRLDETLENVSKHYDREVPKTIKKTFAILEAAHLLFLAPVVG